MTDDSKKVLNYLCSQRDKYGYEGVGYIGREMIKEKTGVDIGDDWEAGVMEEAEEYLLRERFDDGYALMAEEHAMDYWRTFGSF